MSELASPGQLRAAFLRWALVLAPGMLLLGFISGALSGSGAENPWFDALVKPSLYPPPATFGIVWSLLYLLMGLATAMVVTAWGAPLRGAALAAFGAQFVINLVWSPLFFALHKITAALILLAVLDVMVIAAVVLYWKVRQRAAMLLLPYLAWVLFATALNWQFLQANPGEDGGEVPGAVTQMEI